jgi:hypothetical protein
LVADIPFSFNVNGVEMPAGAYEIKTPLLDVRSVVLLTDGENQRIAMGINASNGEPGAPRLIFHCDDDDVCTLSEIWDDDGTGVRFPEPKLSSAEAERVAMVPVHRLKPISLTEQTPLGRSRSWRRPVMD